MASTDARPIPIKNTAFRAVFPILDADGDLVTGATGLDSEVSKDQGTFADCTNEATEIATSSGMYYLDLTSTEMNADCVAVIVKTSSSGAKTTVLVFYPEEAGDINVDVTAWNGTAIPGVDTAGYPKVTIKDGTGTGEIDTTSGGVLVAAIAANAITATAINADAITAAKIADGAIDRATFAEDTGLQTIRSNTAQAGAAGSITLDASASATTDFYKGSWIFLTGGTGVGQVRLCTAYNGGTKVATIAPNWATNPGATSTFAVLPSAGVDLELIAAAAVSTSTAQLGVNAVQAGGTAWGSGAITAAAIASNAITSAKIASGAITSTGIAASAIGASQLASGAITNAKFAAGAIDAAAIAADAIGASELAADAATEIGTAVWATAARTLTAATNITSTGGTTVPQTGDSYARLGAPAGASVSADVAAVKTDTGNILTKLLKYVQLLVRKDAAIATDNATELTAINANGGSGGGSFDNTTDSEQAIRDNMTTPPTAAAIADQVWEEAIADHSGTTGSTAEALNSAGSAGDPWTTALPGAYGAGSAGKIIGDNINATISSRASQTSVDTIDDYVDTEIAAIKAKTDLIPAAPAAVGDIPTAVQNADALLGRNIAGGSSTGRTVKQALRALRNKVTRSGGTITVFQEDDTTSDWTASYTTDGAAEPITEVDPS